MLAYFDRPGTSNGPTQAINVRLEYLRGSAVGFRNLANYITRSLLQTGGFTPHVHPSIGKIPERGLRAEGPVWAGRGRIALSQDWAHHLGTGLGPPGFAPAEPAARRRAGPGPPRPAPT